ncbi:hypothetical protein Daus18300_011407 [Diaporthe australafricana]|uniref:Ubiquitin-like domain-containing protein n=1 Tax=Diaporthe australafricana TaxID=127596 RepID=A0ABR3W6P0_9PEZI
MSSVTFGSVGDIITVCLLAKSIVDALDKSRGSSAEYQGLVSELRSLEKALLQPAQLFARPLADSSITASLREETLKLVHECRKTLESFHSALKSYDASLAENHSVGGVRRIGMKIRWQLSQKETIARFRAEISGHCNAINMMMITAQITVSLRGLENQQALASLGERDLAEQNAALDTIRNEIQRNHQLSSSMNSIVRALLDRFNWFGKLLVSVKRMVSTGLMINLATHRAVLSMQASMSNGLDRPLIQEPFVLEDALGRIAPVHLQFITSWQALEAVMLVRFEGLPGREKITTREFVLQEQATKREICLDQPWEIAFRPGSFVTMSLAFRRDIKSAKGSNSCPYCGESSDKASSAEVCCMIYRRITEVVEVDQTIPDLPKHWSQRPQFGSTAFNWNPSTFGPFPKRKRKMDEWTELSLSVEIRSFKRVRILSKLEKTKKSAFTTWDQEAPWVGLGAANASVFNGANKDGHLSAPPVVFNKDIIHTSILSGAVYFEDKSETSTEDGTEDGSEDGDLDDSTTEPKSGLRSGSLVNDQPIQRDETSPSTVNNSIAQLAQEVSYKPSPLAELILVSMRWCWSRKVLLLDRQAYRQHYMYEIYNMSGCYNLYITAAIMERLPFVLNELDHVFRIVTNFETFENLKARGYIAITSKNGRTSYLGCQGNRWLCFDLNSNVQVYDSGNTERA